MKFIKNKYRIFLIVLIINLIITPLYAQLQVSFSPRYSEIVNGDVLNIGNNMLSTSSTSNYNGTGGNHDLTLVNVDIDADATTFNSSNASLTNPVPLGCLKIKRAFLYWAAADYPDPGNEPTWNYNQIKIQLPGQVTYTTLTADNIIYQGRTTNFSNNPYACFKDISSLITSLTNPFGTYQLANVKAKTGSLTNGGNIGCSAGWQIVFVYEGATDVAGNSILPARYISLSDGFANVTSTQNNYNIPISGFETPPVGSISAKLVFGALEGDRDLTGDRFQIRNLANTFVDLSTTNRTADNFFCSRITNQGTDFTNRNPTSTNTTGFDAGIFTPSNPNLFTNSQTSTVFRLTSTQETYGVYLLGFSIDSKSPNLQPLLQASTPVNVNPGDVVNYSLTLENQGNDDARNVVLTSTLAPEVDLIEPIIPLPVGVTYTFNPVSRVLSFFVANGLLDQADPAFIINYQVRLKSQCYFLETNCSTSFSSRFIATFNGLENPNLFSALSSSGIVSCGFGNGSSNITTINTPSQAVWATSPNDLNRTINCNDATALSAANALFPLTDKCNFTLSKTSGSYIALPNSNCPNIGSYTNTWIFTDKCGRISSQFRQIITVVDVTAPQISNVPSNTTVSCRTAVPLAATVTTSDNCGGAVSVSVSDVTSDSICADRYTITRTWTATDACGNSSSASQTIRVNDQTAPVITEVPASVVLRCPSEVPAADIADVEATDGCGGIVSVSVSDVTSDSTCANRYTITRTWTATDACGNSSSASQTIRVNDQTAPQISNVPSNTTVSCRTAVPLAVTVTTSDNCGGAVSVSVSDVTSDSTCANRYTITRTWTATDACGNSASASQTIRVNDQTAPQISNVQSNTTVSCRTAVPLAATVTTSDNCGGAVSVSVNDVTSDSTCANRYTITRTWTATDACGNSSSASQTIRVNDQTAPQISNVPSNTTVSCRTAVPLAATVTTSDNCGGAVSVSVSVSDVTSDSTCANRYTITRTWTATDACGNSSSASQTIRVNDQTAPQISNVPSNTTVSCRTAVPLAATVTTSDNCGGAVSVSVNDVTSDSTCANRYTITRTWTATDACGNNASASQTIRVDDQTAPVITEVPASVVLSCTSEVPAADISDVEATDGCGGAVSVSVSDVTSDSTCANRYTITRTWTATDACGNSSSASQTIRVDDQTAPVITEVPASVVLSCASEVPAADIADVEATDGCGGAVSVSVSDVTSDSTCANRYTITRTWTATDACGNSSSASQTITVNDQTAPQISNVPSNTTVSCRTAVPLAATVTTSDNCGGAVSVSVNDVTSDSTCANRYTITRTWTATDACGNNASASQTIRVDDQTAPVITEVPASVVLSCTSEVPAADISDVEATDGCGGAVSVSVSDVTSDSTCANRYTITRTWTATDACGNSSSASQTIKVDDQTAPQISNVPSNTTVSCRTAVPLAATVTTSDNCGGAVSVSVSDVTSDSTCANRYTITRTWTATDACGNSASASQTIKVDDQTAPVITEVPASVVLSCPSEVPAADISDIEATDGCGGAVSVSVSDVTSDSTCANRYTITRTWTATDACGNSSSASQTIKVDDQTAPQISNVPSNTTVSCRTAVPLAATVTTSDNCGGAVSVSVSDVTSDSTCANRYTITRTWTATDACGNSASASQTIKVDDQTAPVITEVPASVVLSCPSEVPAADISDIEATDGCGGAVSVSVSDVTSDSTCANRYTITRTWTATDACGNNASASQTIRVDDQTAPQISNVPSNTTVSCRTAVPLAATVTTSDNCGGAVSVSVSDVTSDSTCANRYTITRTWTATDACGNSASASQTIKVDDQTAPVITEVPASVVLSCPSEVPAADISDIEATDGCGGAVSVSVSDVTSDSTCANRYTITRTWTATDACGNSSSASQTIKVDDQTAPQISNVPSNTTVSCRTAVPLAATVTTSDNCGGAVSVSVSDVTSDSTCANRYTITRTWTATDACGNSASASQTIKVDDQTAPVITEVPASVVLSCPSEVPAADISDIEATDGCGGAVSVSVSDVTSDSTCANRYTITRTWTATDACGNNASASQTIRVDDQTAPVITEVPASVVLSCPSEVPAADISDIEATDGCGGAVNVSVSDVTSDSTCANRYTITRTWTATDACGNNASASQTIRVDDQTAPVITEVPASVVLSCPSEVPAADISDVEATDGCGGAVSVSVSDVTSDSTCANRYTITRTWTATDACGNNASASQTIRVDDQTAPVITEVPASVVLSCPSEVPAADISDVEATDGCGGAVSVSVNDVTSDSTCANRYTITRTWTATDACGNNASASQTIRVDDQTAPVITEVPASVVLSCTSEVPAADIADVEAMDGCGGAVSVSVSDVTSDSTCANRYTITRTWTATDACGNSASASQTIRVYDTINPSFDQDLPEDMIVCDIVPDVVQLTATDNCGNVNVIFSEQVDSISQEDTKTFVRTWSLSDKCGNTINHTQKIVVHFSKYTNLSYKICNGDSILIGEKIYKESGIYVDTLQTQFDCDSIIQTNLFVSPVYNVQIIDTICSGDSIIVNGKIYKESGVYLDSLKSINGCDSILTIDLFKREIKQAEIDINGINVLCSNINSISLYSINTYDSYQWYKNGQIIEGATLQDYDATKSGNYSILVTQFGCTSKDTIAIIESTECPEIDTLDICIVPNNDTTFCFKESIVDLPGNLIGISFCEIPNQLVNIKFDTLNACFTVLFSSNITFKDTFCILFCDNLGFCDTMIVHLCTEKVTLPPIAENDCVEGKRDEILTINVLLNDKDPDGDVFTLNTIIKEPKHGIVLINQDQTLTYTPVSAFCGKDTLYYEICDKEDGCDTAYVCLNIKCICEYPELLTPNGDNLNDNLVIPCIANIDNVKLRVWNRWGSFVYEDINYKNNWNGTYDGEPLPEGTYWYSIEFVDPENGEHIMDAKYFMIVR
jgi:gliding motility-associated-like protein/uncharacterized repeat protein (TIGR01451 family)